jgi:ATPase family associated with various cellular activities (AAA)
MDQTQFLRDALCLPTNVIAYHVSQQLGALFPDKTLVESADGLFNIEEYARAGLCRSEYTAFVYNQILTHWRGNQLGPPTSPQAMTLALMRTATLGYDLPSPAEAGEEELLEVSRNAWLKIEWQGHPFDLIMMNWSDMGRPIRYHWILADERQAARDLLSEVCRWNAEVRGEVLVFDNGCWHKDAHLFASIQGSTFENLILQGHLKQEIRQDLEQFFAAHATYEAYGIPWKRGVLFVGPPGNGKTHAVKAIINALKQPCLYVKSLRTDMGTEEHNIHSVFERARRSAPCILVLEDLDSLLNAQNRSYFLNELDGFATNVGIVVVATTNHPERLDPAILDRPSRFDRKYPFDLPELAERTAYIELWNHSLTPSLQISQEVCATLSALTEGFSFAYLKELFLSSMMRWIATQEGTMEETLNGQVQTLREQMISTRTQEEEGPSQPTLPSSHVWGRRVFFSG